LNLTERLSTQKKKGGGGRNRGERVKEKPAQVRGGGGSRPAIRRGRAQNRRRGDRG